MHTHKRICTFCSERAASVYADVHDTCLTYTPVHAWCSQNLWKHAYSPQKMHMDSCMRAYATVQKLLCHGSSCEFTLSHVRASPKLLFAARFCRPFCCRPNPSPDAVRSRNPSKSTLSHDTVAAAVSHKHHLIIRVGAGLIQFVYESHPRLSTKITSSKILFWPFFRASSQCGGRVSGHLRFFKRKKGWLARWRSVSCVRVPWPASEETPGPWATPQYRLNTKTVKT